MTRPTLSEPEDRILPFRPRGSMFARNVPRPPPVPDLEKFERAADEPDDFRHRMLANIAAFAFTVALLAIGIWLAMSIAHLRRTQDCVLMGRHDCVQITPGQT